MYSHPSQQKRPGPAEAALGWPRFQKSQEKFMLAVFSESYGILEWENTFDFVSGCKSTLLNHYEIYKGNSKKYKGKMWNQDILVFGPKNNFVDYIRWLAAFLKS